MLAHAEEAPYVEGEKPPIELSQLEARLGTLAEEARELGSEKVSRILDGRQVADAIVVPDRLVNVVTAAR